MAPPRLSPAHPRRPSFRPPQRRDRVPAPEPEIVGGRMREYLLNAFVTLFVTLDPIGLAPIFVVVTSGMRGWERRRIALLAASVAAGVLVGFALFGAQLIGFLGISLPAFRIA